MEYKTLLTLLLLLLTHTACKTKTQEKYIAKVEDEYLYETEVLAALRNQPGKVDTSIFVQNYATNWLQQKLMLQKAEMNLSEEQLNLETQLQEYKNSLVIYTYEKELLRQKLDTVIQEQEAKEYYEKNKDNFVLKDNLVKVSYLKIPTKSPDISKVKMWLKNENEHLDELEEYAAKYAENYLIDNNNWLLFNQLMVEIPLVTDSPEDFIAKNSFFEVKEDNNVYLVHIKQYQLAGSASPMSVEMPNIRSLIVNKRREKLLKELQETIYQEGLQNSDVEIKLSTTKK